ncbi:hypothetical protein AAVH_01417 [Aphelenchoides avenae]|nr:hypothetical protein AAVH_01417 [Aphelenchus avenae]
MFRVRMTLCFTSVLWFAAYAMEIRNITLDNKIVPDNCQSIKCENNGVCQVAPHAHDSFVCHCPSCYNGIKCENLVCENHEYELSTFRHVVRGILISVTSITIILTGVALYFRHRRMKESSLKKSWCRRIYSGLMGQEATIQETKDSKNTSTRLSKCPIKSAACDAKRAPSRGESKRQPAFDEVEMRRRGLVNRRCERPNSQGCPTPPSATVSQYTHNEYMTPIGKNK